LLRPGSSWPPTPSSGAIFRKAPYLFLQPISARFEYPVGIPRNARVERFVPFKPILPPRLAHCGAGLNLKTNRPTAEQVAEAVRTVLADPAYREHAEVIQADLARHDAPQEAAERTKGPVDCVKGNRLHKDSAP